MTMTLHPLDSLEGYPGPWAHVPGHLDKWCPYSLITTKWRHTKMKPGQEGFLISIQLFFTKII